MRRLLRTNYGRLVGPRSGPAHSWFCGGPGATLSPLLSSRSSALDRRARSSSIAAATACTGSRFPPGETSSAPDGQCVRRQCRVARAAITRSAADAPLLRYGRAARLEPRSHTARLALGGREHQAGHDEQPRDQPDQSGHLDVSHAHTMSKRSVWTRSAGTPSSTRAISAASIMGPGPQMKN
jgi:hypothetical protein